MRRQNPLRAGHRPQLRELIAGLPKVELHRHLPGSLRLNTIIELADEYGYDLPSRDPQALLPFVQVTADMPRELGPILRTLGDFQRRCFVSTAALARFAFEMVEDAYHEGIRYLEVRYSPLTMAGDALSFEEAISGIRAGLRQAHAQYRIQTPMVLGMSRTADLQTCASIADLALDLASDGDVVGVDLLGDEAGAPAGEFAELFERIRADGRLGITVHAGESAGPESVRDAIVRLGAQRIGHGVRAIHDPQVVELVLDKGVVLETCPVSNVLTGAVPALGEHPLPQFLRSGVAATINADDPSWFDTDLNREYHLALTELGLSFDELRQAVAHAAHGAFLPDAAAKASLLSTVEAAYRAAGPQFAALGFG